MRLMDLVRPTLRQIPLLRRARFARRSKRRPCAESAYGDIVERLNAWCGPLDGKKVLEIGAAPIPDFIAEIDRRFHLSEAVGINLVIKETRSFSRTLRVEPGDVRKMCFSDEYFDLAISSSVFEHVHNFDVALREMFRVLKPGGYLFSHFGPIWSGSYGHHLWWRDGSKTVTYHDLLLPAFCHLLMTKSELFEWLTRRGHQHAGEIARYVFRSTDQNQLMFSDYRRLIDRSQFKIMFIKGYDHQKLQQNYAKTIDAHLLHELNERYPADRDMFLYDGITLLLRKPVSVDTRCA